MARHGALSLSRRLDTVEARIGRIERRDPFELVYAFNPWLKAHPEVHAELRQLAHAITDDDAFELWIAGDWKDRSEISTEQRAAITVWDHQLGRCLLWAAQEDLTGIIAQHMRAGDSQ